MRSVAVQEELDMDKALTLQHHSPPCDHSVSYRCGVLVDVVDHADEDGRRQAPERDHRHLPVPAALPERVTQQRPEVLTPAAEKHLATAPCGNRNSSVIGGYQWTEFGLAGGTYCVL